MRQKLYAGLYIVILVIFVATCVLQILELTRSKDLTKEINQLKSSSSQAKELKKMHTDLENEQQSGNRHFSQLNQLSSQLNQLQNNYTDLQSQVTKIQQTKDAAKGKVAFLTFDDGPSNLTVHVLDILKSNNVNATFFVVGENAVVYPEVVKRAYNEGNVIGNHTWSHNYSIVYASESSFFNDFNNIQTYLTSLLGVAPLVCRYPGGTNNMVSQRYSDHVMRLIDSEIKTMGIKPYDWNAYSGDSESGPKPSKDTIVHNVMKDAMVYKDPVILFHDTSPNGNDLLALPEIIKELRDDGYTFGVLTPFAPDCQFKPV